MAPEAHPLDPSPPTETERAYGFGRYVAVGALALAGGIIAGGVYTAKTPTKIKIGPHDASIEFTASPDDVINFGPLGTAEKPTGWEFGGARITLEGIPSQSDPNQSALGSASAAARQYEQLLADPDHIKNTAIHTVVTRAWHNGAEGAALFAPSSLVLLGVAGHRKQREGQRHAAGLQALDSLGAAVSDEQRAALLHAIEPPKISLARLWGTLVIGSLLVTAACGDSAHPTQTLASTEADPVLQGTPFEGYSLHGLLLQLTVDQGGGRLKAFIDTNDAFYRQAAMHFQDTFNAKFQNTPLDHKGLIYVLSISDNHCNLGMNELYRLIKERFTIDGTFESGDITMSGSAAEEECVSAEADALKGKPILLAPGNHDNGDDGHGSTPVEDFAAKYGITVLTLGKMVDLAGLKVTGAPDPMQSTMGTPMHQHGSQSIADVANELAVVAQAQHPDVIVAHEPEMLTLAASQGNVGFALAGHTHTFQPPVQTNENTGSVMMVEGTSGGVQKDTFTIGPLRQTSVECVLVFDTASKEAIGYYLIQVQPDTRVSISDFLPINRVIVSPKLQQHAN